jgi:hypothetical protein
MKHYKLTNRSYFGDLVDDQLEVWDDSYIKTVKIDTKGRFYLTDYAESYLGINGILYYVSGPPNTN